MQLLYNMASRNGHLLLPRIPPWHREIVTITQWIWYRCHGTNSPLHLASLNGIVKLLLCSNHIVAILIQNKFRHGKTCHGHLYIWHLGMVIVKFFIITWCTY